MTIVESNPPCQRFPPEKELSSAVDSRGFVVRGVLAALAASVFFFALFVSTFFLDPESTRDVMFACDPAKGRD